MNWGGGLFVPVRIGERNRHLLVADHVGHEQSEFILVFAGYDFEESEGFDVCIGSEVRALFVVVLSDTRCQRWRNDEGRFVFVGIKDGMSWTSNQTGWNGHSMRDAQPDLKHGDLVSQRPEVRGRDVRPILEHGDLVTQRLELRRRDVHTAHQHRHLVAQRLEVRRRDFRPAHQRGDHVSQRRDGIRREFILSICFLQRIEFRLGRCRAILV